MLTEQHLEIRDYLAQCHPLLKLPTALLDQLALAAEVQHASADQMIMQIGETNDKVFLIRYGAVEILQENGELHGRYGGGDWFGYRSVMRGGTVGLNVRVLEDALFYSFAGQLFRDLLENSQRIASYFSERKPERLRTALQELRHTDDYSMVTLQVSDLMKLPLLVQGGESIQQVARQMSQTGSRTALIIDTQAQLSGIVTDTDFRSVAAEGLDIQQPVLGIMTPQPLTLSPNNQASEALLLMARRNIRHVPVLDQGEVVGVISASDLLRGQSHGAIYLVGDIFAARTVEQLAELSKGLPKVLVGLVRQSLPAYDIGHAITSIGQAITRRLLGMAEERFGKAPVPYAFIVAGSMARREQTAHSDQDNGMILSDEYRAAEHGAYFSQVAQFVSDGLDACGYVYCPGHIMATNEQWRQPFSVWRNYFLKWIDSPQPQALLNASIFFDLRCLHGDESLLQRLQSDILARTKTQTVFQAFMAGNALSHRPPLGFFRGFVLDKDKDGSDEKGMDMKKRGVVPVIDLARVYALANGIQAVNTWERLDAIAAVGGLTPEGVADIKDAFEFISMVRLQHQAKQISQGQKPNNYVPPEELSALERRHLKDAFEVVSTLQDSMSSRYHADRFR